MSTAAAALVRVGTRGSALARRQAALVMAALARTRPGVECQIVVFETRGDRDLQSSLPQIGGSGVFTAELEAALRSGAITFAVHSLKDLPTAIAPDLAVCAVLERGDPADVLVSRSGRTLADLPVSPAIGTSSLRRAAQVLERRPDARLLPLRGNVETRVRRALAADGPYDAIVLAAAGLDRLGMGDCVTQRFAPADFLPAPGQGAIAIQCGDDEPARALARGVNHRVTWAAVSAERAFLAILGAGCSAPAAGFGRVEQGRLALDVLVGSSDGRATIRASGTGDPARAEELGADLARQVLARGAAALLTRTGNG